MDSNRNILSDKEKHIYSIVMFSSKENNYCTNSNISELLNISITQVSKLVNSYLMLNDIKVYIDSRCDFYTEEYNGVTIATDYNKITECSKEWKELVEKYNINTFLIKVDENESLCTLLTESEEFEEVYRDEVAVIYTSLR